MTHETEIKYWAEHPDGTRVWLKYEDCDWTSLQDHEINWRLKDGIYIVDNQWAELRKAQADGKQLQYNEGTWEDRILILSHIDLYNILDWRIKSEEPVYEWQWIWFCERTGRYAISGFMTEDEANEWFVKYEPSKRERK